MSLRGLSTLNFWADDVPAARGDSGFVTASVVDPFGNILGVMSTPHYLEVVASLKDA